MKKTFKKIHLWLSIPFGLVITLVCFSGAMLVFEKEVMELSNPTLYFVEKVGKSPLPINELLPQVATTLPDSVTITGVSISPDPERAYQLNLSKPRRASVYVDQYTGEVKGKYERAPFFTFMFRMHRWLLDSMKPGGGIFWGKMIVGTSTLVFVFVLISGLVIWIPRTRKALKSRLKIATNKGWKRFWYDLHVAGGMYALVLLLAMALTGLTWSFSWYRTGFYNVFGVEAQQGGGHGSPQQPQQNRQASPGEGRGEQAANQTESSQGGEGRRGRGNRKGGQGERRGDRKQGSTFTNWQEVYDQLNKLNPDNKQITLTSGSATVSSTKLGNQRATDRYTFDPQTGAITETTLYKDLPKEGKIRGWIYSVHVGSWGGITTRILTCLAALLGASLPLTGYYFWIKRIVKKKRVRAN